MGKYDTVDVQAESRFERAMNIAELFPNYASHKGVVPDLRRPPSLIIQFTGL